MDAAAASLLSQQGADAIVTAEGIADADHQAGVLGTGGHGQGGRTPQCGDGWPRAADGQIAQPISGIQARGFRRFSRLSPPGSR